MNPLFNLVTSFNKGNVLMQAINAAMRGESPEAFMKTLSKSDPRFRNLDMDNLEKTANDLCARSGVDPEALKSQVRSYMNTINGGKST